MAGLRSKIWSGSLALELVLFFPDWDSRDEIEDE
jgi:hypothetical protein